MAEEALSPGEHLGMQVKFWRNQRKLTAQALADRLTLIGAPTLTRVAISKIEVGARGVSLDEWLQLAHALAVPPPLLFLDLEQGTPVRIAAQVAIDPWLAWNWVVGEQAPPMTDRTVAWAEDWFQSQTAVRLYRQRQTWAGQVDNAKSRIRQAEFTGDEEHLKAARAEYAAALAGLAPVLDEMVEVGMRPPAEPESWIEDIRRLGLSKYPDSLRVFVDGER